MRYLVEPERKRLPCRWGNLTHVERGNMANGCGGKGGWFDPPEYLFHASCNHHDFNYWLGGDEEDRAWADEQFLEKMLFDAGSAPWYSRWWLKGAAYRYYFAVRWLGGKFFNYRGPESNHEQWERLERVMSTKEL